MNDGRLKALFIKTEREMQRDKENESTRDKQRDKIKAGAGEEGVVEWQMDGAHRLELPLCHSQPSLSATAVSK